MCVPKMKYSILFVLILLAAPQIAFSSIATYQLTVSNEWTLDTYPINYPTDAHLSWLGGGTHAVGQSFWGLGELASPGLELMAETGVTTEFVDEIAAASGSPLEWRQWFCQPTATNASCGPLTVEFTIDSSQPLITLTSMLGPSPDWFVGVSGLNLFAGGSWVDSIIAPLALYDAGTEDGTTPVMSNPATAPQTPITYISYDSVTGAYLPSAVPTVIGSFTFELVSASPVPLPSTVWLFVSGLLLFGLISFLEKHKKKKRRFPLTLSPQVVHA